MNKTESLKDFYTRNPLVDSHGYSPNAANGNVGHFNVFSRTNCFRGSTYRRRDYYKISLIIGAGRLYYADKWIEVDRPSLLFSNPGLPYAWDPISQRQEGYYCLFTEAFIAQGHNDLLHRSPIFRIGGQPLFFIDDQQQTEISGIFARMMTEMDSAYDYKYDLLRTYVHLIIHHALKMQPVVDFRKHINANARITELFLELLERQFPVDGHDHTLQLRTATQYAENLSVHVNHLNRAVRETTGKTTTQHISDRIVKEARTLLIHSSWTIAEIAYSLGFEYPTYFNNFFKKHTQATPLSIRKELMPENRNR
ncbi:MAG TPA: helix-turn-helix domain-containing protein [Puia sp.]|nr:helix-turn-helix domain-containing protein [Puia sp.]